LDLGNLLNLDKVFMAQGTLEGTAFMISPPASNQPGVVGLTPPIIINCPGVNFLDLVATLQAAGLCIPAPRHAAVPAIEGMD
jgi:hypothetical protein